MADIQFDAISWERDANDDIMPLLPPKPFNYPAEDEVELDVVYGYDDQFLGSLVPVGTSPNAPTLGTPVSSAGQLTTPVTTDVQTNVIWLLYRKIGSAGSWSAPDVAFTRTGDGNIDVTGLDDGNNYEVIGYTRNVAHTCASLPSVPVYGIPGAAGTAIDPLIIVCDLVAEYLSTQVFSQVFTAECKLRVNEDLSHFDSLTVYTVPRALESGVSSRRNELVDYTVQVAIMRPVSLQENEDELREMMDLTYEIREATSMTSLGAFQYVSQSNNPVYNANRLEMEGMFVSIIELNYKNLRGA